MTPVHFDSKRFADSRGWFTESWSRKALAERGIDSDFCQDNHSYSRHAGTIRGLHFQRIPHAQAKLVRCLRGSVFDVAVDIRHGSPSYGQWVSCILSAEQGNQFFIPSGFAHGFLTMEDHCEIAYKVDSYYAPDADAGIIWNDPAIGIDWPLKGRAPVLSDKDMGLPQLHDLDTGFVYDETTMVALADAD
jgi:dTDP-4-dehydrorhamnose 3,5-epimerase